MATLRKRKKYDWTLPPEIRNRLGEVGYGHQRAFYEAEHLLIVLHAPPAHGDRERTELVFLQKPDGKLQCNGQDNGEFQLNHLLAEYPEQFEAYDESYDALESSPALFELIEHLIPLNRAVNNLSNTLQSVRQHARSDAFLIAKRDEANEISRNLEILLHEATLSLDFRIAQSAETQAAKAHEMTLAQHKLNVLAAVTFPVMAVATLFGMGLVHGLENKPPYLFWFIFVIGFVMGMLTKRWVTNERPEQ